MRSLSIVAAAVILFAGALRAEAGGFIKLPGSKVLPEVPTQNVLKYMSLDMLQDDLQLTHEQRKRLPHLRYEYERALHYTSSALGNESKEELQQRQVLGEQIEAEVDAAVVAMLRPEQGLRLEQLFFQTSGPTLFDQRCWPEVCGTFDLSATQSKSISTVLAKLESDRMALWRAFGNDPVAITPDVARRQAELRVQEFHREQAALQEIARLLNPQQRSHMANLCGAPIDLRKFDLEWDAMKFPVTRSELPPEEDFAHEDEPVAAEVNNEDVANEIAAVRVESDVRDALAYLRTGVVRSELALTRDQHATLAGLVERFERSYQLYAGTDREDPEWEARRNARIPVLERLLKDCEAFLRPEQRVRLEQIRLQLDGAFHFGTHGPLVKQLRITEQQRLEAVRIIETFGSESDALHRQLFPDENVSDWEIVSDAYQAKLRPAQQEFEVASYALEVRTVKRLTGLLRPEQFRQFSVLQGRPADTKRLHAQLEDARGFTMWDGRWEDIEFLPNGTWVPPSSQWLPDGTFLPRPVAR